MKLLLFVLLMVGMIGCNGQIQKKSVTVKTNREFQWPKPIRDSQWMEEMDVDTVWGTIEIYVQGGTMAAKGFVRSSLPMHCNANIYSPKDKSAIDSFENKQKMWMFNGGCSGWGDPIRVAYIITSKGIKKVQGNFTLKVN